MKKTKYNAPQIKVVRFKTEDILDATIISGKEIGKDVATAGKVVFGSSQYQIGQ